MRTPIFAIAWQLWRRHRLGLIVVLATLGLMSLTYPSLFAWSRSESVLIVSLIPVIGVFGYLMNVLVYADRTGDLAGGYPRRMYVLPVPTRTLVLWPMLSCAVVMVLAWLAIACLAYRPSGSRTPVVLPALGLAVTMAWIQALSWSPFGNAWVRVAVTSVLLTALFALLPLLRLAAVSMVGIEAVLVTYFAPATILAWAGLARDRRGDVWEFGLGRIGAILETRTRGWPRRNRSFRSAAEAQLWYEWRCHGLYLPVIIAGPWLLMGAAMIVFGRNTNPRAFPVFLAVTFGMPLLMVGSQGVAIASMQPFWLRRRDLITFVATRPMRSDALVAAKFRMAWRSLLLMWALIVISTLMVVLVSGHLGDLADLGRMFFAQYPDGRGVLILALAIGLLPVLTWKQLTDGFAPVLTGRRWVGDGLTSLGVVGFIGLCAGGAWCATHPATLPKLQTAVPWLVGVTVIVKVVVAVFAFRLALRRGLTDGATFRLILAGWLAVTGCAIGLVLLIAPGGAGIVSTPVLLLGVGTFVPLGRFPLATLALDWNRHR